MHILDIDDAPYISNEYSRPSYCKASPLVEDCLDKAGKPLPTQQCYDCYFGKIRFLNNQSSAAYFSPSAI